MKYSTKALEGNKVKAEMQRVLKQIPMTCIELKLHFKLDKKTVSNYLTSLKKYGLVSWHHNFNTGHVMQRKYYAHYDGENFLELLDRLKNSEQERIAQKHKARELEVKKAKTNPNIRIFSMDDDIFKQAQKHREKPKFKNEWRGYSSMAGL